MAHQHLTSPPEQMDTESKEANSARPLGISNKASTGNKPIACKPKPNGNKPTSYKPNSKAKPSRVILDKESQEHLNQMLLTLKSEESCLRISPSSLTSWIICYFAKRDFVRPEKKTRTGAS